MTLSPEQILAGLVVLTGCITFLFKLLQSSQSQQLTAMKEGCDERIKEKDEMISWLKSELRTALRTTERSVAAAETATTVAKKATEEA